MSTKTCKGCGWVYPKEWPGRRCSFCGTKFTDGICAVCGKYSEKLNRYRCTTCETKRYNAWRDAHKDNAEELYQEWCNAIAMIPTPYQTLTEEQWLETCKHFGGCAYCGAEAIDVRSMFIKFDKGGRYCAWNIIPACEKCETSLNSISNPFLRMNNKIYRSEHYTTKKLGYNLDNLQKITQYLKSKMESIDGKENSSV